MFSPINHLVESYKGLKNPESPDHKINHSQTLIFTSLRIGVAALVAFTCLKTSFLAATLIAATLSFPAGFIALGTYFIAQSLTMVVSAVALKSITALALALSTFAIGYFSLKYYFVIPLGLVDKVIIPSMFTHNLDQKLASKF